MRTSSSHFRAELVNPTGGGMSQVDSEGKISGGEDSSHSEPNQVKRVIIVTNGLPVRMTHDPEKGAAYGHSWHFEMDEAGGDAVQTTTPTTPA